MAESKVIVGLGKTGLSCARYFSRHGIDFAVMDQNPSAANLNSLRDFAPLVHVGPVSLDSLLLAQEIVLSPGVPRASREIAAALGAGVRVTSDVEIFAGLAQGSIVAITGSNGKSTVTALLGEMARVCGLDVGVGGNIGTPCLDLLEPAHSVYVLELSSYQLETATDLPCAAAVVLNLSPDHMDRYPDVEAYYRAKAGIYARAEVAVVNRSLDYPFDLSGVKRVVSFGQNEPTEGHFGVRVRDGATMICLGDRNLINVSELLIKGGHNCQNALAALSLGYGLGWKLDRMVDALRTFPGLPHRCEWVADIDGVSYINDSKSTNVGSAMAALEGLGPIYPGMILILGGQGKGADFSELAPLVRKYVSHLFVYGADKRVIESQVSAGVACTSMSSLAEVIAAIKGSAVPGQLVLLSPGCASLDQFRNFEDRGDQFKSMVMEGAAP